MNFINKDYIGDDVAFTTISDNKFKSTKLSISFILPLDKKTVSEYALLAGLLTRSTQDYPDFTILSKKLSMLYGANLLGSIRKLGDNQVVTISLSGIDDKYAFEGDVVSQDMSKLLCDVIFHPKLNGNSFCEDEINQEKRQLKDIIDSEFNDKRAYASNRFTSIMFEKEPFGIYRFGTKEDIDSLTGEELYVAWKNMLSHAKVEIFFIGESSSDSAKAIFKNSFSGYSRKPCEIKNSIIPHDGEVLRVSEQMELSQSKMIMGFRTPVAVNSGEEIAMRVAISLLGGTAHSKLFNNVREKLSLCYYCASRFYRIKGFVTIESGVEKSNIEKAESAILNEIQEMKNGNISDFELKATKLSMCNDFAAVCDYESGLENWYFSQIMDTKIRSVEEMCSELNAVTKEQIITAIKTLEYDTIYVLESK